MKYPFCYPSPRHWETKKDETVTVSQFFETLDWDGTKISVVGSQANDYNGASHLFEIKVDRDLVIKLKARFHEYKKRFPSNYHWGPDGYIRISVY